MTDADLKSDEPFPEIDLGNEPYIDTLEKIEVMAREMAAAASIDFETSRKELLNSPIKGSHGRSYIYFCNLDTQSLIDALELGADFNYRNSSYLGNTMLHQAISNEHVDKNGRHYDTEVMLDALIEYNRTHPDARIHMGTVDDLGKNVLHFAAMLGQPDVVRKILEAEILACGGTVNASDFTSVRFDDPAGQAQFSDFLLAVDAEGRSVINLAAMRGDDLSLKPVLAVLSQTVPDISLEPMLDNDGHSPRDASNAPAQEVAELLESVGIRPERGKASLHNCRWKDYGTHAIEKEILIAPGEPTILDACMEGQQITRQLLDNFEHGQQIHAPQSEIDEYIAGRAAAVSNPYHNPHLPRPNVPHRIFDSAREKATHATRYIRKSRRGEENAL